MKNIVYIHSKNLTSISFTYKLIESEIFEFSKANNFNASLQDDSSDLVIRCEQPGGDFYDLAFVLYEPNPMKASIYTINEIKDSKAKILLKKLAVFLDEKEIFDEVSLVDYGSLKRKISEK